MRRGGYTWRRHTCPRCSAAYTTREHVEYSISYRLQRADGSFRPLSRDELFVMLLDSLDHRKSAINDASALTDTVLGAVYANKRLVVPEDAFHELVADTVRRFDRTAYVKYISKRAST